MKRVHIFAIAVAALGAMGFAVFQAQPVITPFVTVRGVDGAQLAPVAGSTRIYLSSGDTALWMYDRATKRTVMISYGEFWDPEVSRAGDRLAFSRSSEDGNTQYVWSMPLNPKTGLAAGPARRVSASPGDNPSFSPDGKLIAFAGYRDSGPANDISVVPVNGGAAKILAPLKAGAWSVSWQPDGKSIFYLAAQGGLLSPHLARSHSVQRVASTGGRPDTVMLTSGDVSVSPDGKLLLTATGQGQGRRYLISDNMGRKLAEFVLQAGTGVSEWTGPTKILATTVLSPSTITTISLADQRKRVVSDPAGDVIAPTWSPDGQRLAYLKWNGSRLDHVITNADGTGKKVAAGHRDMVAVPPGRGFDWSPDGSAILHHDDDGLYVIDAATGRERKINVPGRAGSVWWPDSRSLLYAKLLDSTKAGFRKELHRITLDGNDRVLREVTVDTNCPACFNIIGDSLIVFGRHGGTSIASLRDNSTARKLFPGDSTNRSNPTISSDGRWLVFRVIRANTFEIVRTDGSERHRIEVQANILTGEDGFWITRDSRDLMFIGSEPSADRKAGVYRVPLAGGVARMLLPLDGAKATSMRDFSISPDGNMVAYITEGQPSIRLGEIDITQFLPRGPQR